MRYQALAGNADSEAMPRFSHKKSNRKRDI